MFSVNASDCVGFDSRWKVKGIHNESTSQTTALEVKSSSTCTASYVDVESQTSDSHPVSKSEVDMQKLADWLGKVFPNVQRELNEATYSKAFYGSYAYEDSVTPETKLLQTLKVQNNAGDGNDPIRVQALSWNSTGNTIAVSCNHLHNTWCHHMGHVNFYTFNRNDNFPELPHKRLSTNSCINVLKFHLTIPFIIACGTYSGELVVWNIQHNDTNNILAKVKGHEDAVLDMSWIHDVDSMKSIILASSSIDGLLNVWNFSLPLSFLTIKSKIFHVVLKLLAFSLYCDISGQESIVGYGYTVLTICPRRHRYKIKSPVFARMQKSSLSSADENSKVVRGILSFDFSVYSHDLFVAGVEGGLVVLCSILRSNTLKGSTQNVPVLDPVMKYYEPHEGEIITVRCSPNRKDMFLSYATDGEIRIYLIDQESPARVIFVEQDMYFVSWVPFQESIITGCGKMGVIEIFHLLSGQSVPNVSTEKIKTMFLHIEVNKQRCSLVAVGNNQGELQIWSVPWGHFSSFKPLE